MLDGCPLWGRPSKLRTATRNATTDTGGVSQATECSSLLSTYKPPSGAYVCPSTETQHYQTNCAPLAFVKPGGQFGSLTVACAVAGTANTRDTCGRTSGDDGWDWSGGGDGSSWSSSYGGFGRRKLLTYSSISFQTFKSGCSGSSRSGWSSATPTQAPVCPEVCPKTCYGT